MVRTLSESSPLDLIKRTLTVEETVVEVSIKNCQALPGDNAPRILGLPAHLVDQLADTITTRRRGPDDLLVATHEGTPISRNTFRTRIRLPAVVASGIDFDVRVHDLRHAHASWLLAGGSDLKSVVDRMGRAQITTTQKYLHTPRRRPEEPRRPQSPTRKGATATRRRYIERRRSSGLIGRTAAAQSPRQRRWDPFASDVRAP
jgi:integrase